MKQDGNRLEESQGRDKSACKASTAGRASRPASRWSGPWRRRLRDGGLLAIGVVAGALVSAVLFPSLRLEAQPDLRLIEEAWSTIQRVYVDRTAVSPTRLTEGAIRGMVDGLGDTGHSRFLTPHMRDAQRQVITGTLNGIGVTLKLEKDRVVVVAPMDGSPAERAGVKRDDVILGVDGQPVSGLPLSAVIERIAGPANTEVRLTVATPPDETPRELTLTRTRVPLHNVSWARLPGTGVVHLRISAFTRGVTEDLRKALEEIGREQASGIVLDLRDNPGGLIEEAVGTASQFLTGGDVLLEKDAAGKIKSFPVRSDGLAPAIPLAVLVNKETASAAEIVAGALQDARRATLLGEKTFGTGTVLQSFPLSDGSALLLGVGEWLTPAGHLIWHQGITPDFGVVLAGDAKPLAPTAERGMSRAQLASSGDTPLLRALDLLEPAPTLASAPDRRAG